MPDKLGKSSIANCFFNTNGQFTQKCSKIQISGAIRENQRAEWQTRSYGDVDRYRGKTLPAKRSKYKDAFLGHISSETVQTPPRTLNHHYQSENSPPAASRSIARCAHTWSGCQSVTLMDGGIDQGLQEEWPRAR